MKGTTSPTGEQDGAATGLLSGIVVAIADSDAAVRNVAVRLLRGAGALTYALDLQELLDALLNARKPSVLILDPEGNARITTAVLQAWPAIPIVFTGAPGVSIAGVLRARHIAKPFDTAALARLVLELSGL